MSYFITKTEQLMENFNCSATSTVPLPDGRGSVRSQPGRGSDFLYRDQRFNTIAVALDKSILGDFSFHGIVNYYYLHKIRQHLFSI